ncbi:hypothetical protein A4X09_0g7322 [Tilletia walkeri]|uniref:Retrotransposon gag domain-containing protein n=1 Tax=Tilletia walkeri TaxID=117179 RepID=A0A8X7N238_9BASI|nr:hypothetical protein A4X09_0g7322 [Tilletia walkeri]
MAPTTRSQQQALATPIDMASNTPTTPTFSAARAADVPDQPEDISVANHPVAPADSVMLALQRSLDRISERLDDMDSRLQKIEGPEEPAEVARVATVAATSSPTRAEASSQPIHSTPSPRSTALPPHLSSKRPPRVVAKDPPRARKVFRALSTPHKDVFRSALERMGSTIWEFLDMVPEEILPDLLTASGGNDEVVDTGRTVVDSGDTSLSASSSLRFRVCKPEYLPEYDGDPYKLDKFLTRVHDLIRNDPDPAWERAVLHALPVKFVDDAEEWHSGLSNEEVKATASFDDLERAMRVQFPMNRAEQRRLARERKWSPTVENAGTYYFAKLRVLRSAFGKNQSDAVLVQDIVNGLPATFRALIRLPRSNARLIDLRAEIGDWEPTWREMHPQFARRPVAATPTSKGTASTAPSAPTTSSASKPASGSAPTTSSSNGPSASGTGSAPRPLPLSATYDPARVTPAANGQPRKYRRPGDETVISLNRPCMRCGQDHFNFEHQHLVPAVQVAEVDEDAYPVDGDETAESF